MLGLMLTSQRKKLILTRLASEGQIVAKVMSLDLGLSEDTIRRDLRELAAEGLLQRVHGGALPVSPAIVDFAGRERLAPDAKHAIGQAAAALIAPGQVVFLDGGTTTLHLARHLPPDLQATVVTHSPAIAVALVEHPSVEVVLVGGRLFKHSVVALGAAALETIRDIRADLYFAGVTGIHPDVGLTTGGLEESLIKRAMILSAAETVVMATTDKLGATSPYVIAPLAEVSTMIVEPGVANGVVVVYEDLGITVIRAKAM